MIISHSGVPTLPVHQSSGLFITPCPGDAALSTMVSCYVTFHLETVWLVYVFAIENSISAAYRKLSFKIFNPLTLTLLALL